MAEPVDYAALAQQARGGSAPPVDYGALASQARGMKSDAKPEPPPEGLMGHVANFAKNFWGDLANTGQGMVNMVAHPIDTVKGIGSAQDAVRLKAQDALKRGDYVEAARHALSYAVPVVGPAIDARGDQAQKGDVSGALGGAASLGLQLAGPSALARTIPAPTASSVAPTARGPILKSTLNPVEQEAVNYLKGQDVPMNAGTVTGNKFVKGAQALAQNQPLGASTAARAARATESGLTRVSGELADQAHPNAVSPESVGTAIPAKLQKNIADLDITRDEAYQDAWQGQGEAAHTEAVPVRTIRKPVYDRNGRDTGEFSEQTVTKNVNMPVDVRDIKAQAKVLLDEMEWMPAADRASNAGYSAALKITKGDDFIPAWQAEKGLSGLKTMARVTRNAGVRDAGQGVAASIIPDLQKGIDAAVAKTGQTAFDGLQRGRATHAHMMEVADLADQLRKEPVQTFNQLTWQNDTGIDFLREIQKQAPDQMPQVGRAFIQGLFDTATKEGGFSKARTVMAQWEKLGPETKKIMYPDPELRASLGKFFKGASMVAENPNPSGTAVVGSLIPGGMLAISNPVAGGAWLLGGAAISKLLFSPRGVALLTDGLKQQSPGAAAFTAAKIRAIAGSDLKLMTPSAMAAAANQAGGQ